MNIKKRAFQFITSLQNWFLKKSLLTKIIIVVLILGSIWFGYTKLYKTESSTQQVQTAQVEKTNIIATVSASGQVTSSNNANVNTQATGVVTKIYAKNGQAVKAGDPIAEISLDQASKQRYNQSLASYKGAQSSLASAQAQQYTLQGSMLQKWETFKNLAESSTFTNGDGTYNEENRKTPEFYIPQDEWLAAEAQYKNQEQVISQAQIALTSSWLSLQQNSPTIYAPISGTVSGLTLQTGSVISSEAGSSDSSTITSQKIASIVTSATPMISVNLTEIDVLQVKVGEKATIIFDALPDKTYTGQVISVDTIGSVNSGVTNYPTLIALDDKEVTILPNMSASANIIINSKNDVLAVPVSAIHTSNGEQYVQVQKNGQIQQVTVETGISSDSMTEITSGLAEGDTVITSTTYGTSNSSSTSGKSAFSTGFGGGAVRVIR
jgi:RND family efflux transporter MFP subunit